MSNPISVILLSTLPDNGIKSLGTKSLLKINDKYIIEYQLENIKNGLKGREFEIILISSFDSNRTIKSIAHLHKKYNIKIIKKDIDNLNFGGAMIYGLNQIKNNSCLIINYGCLFSKNVINYLCSSDNNTIALVKNNQIYDNLKVGCSINNDKIEHLFFGLDTVKFFDITYLNNISINFIKKNIDPVINGNKFTFEIINFMIDNFIDFDYKILHTKDAVFIDNLNILKKARRMIKHDTNVNKTK